MAYERNVHVERLNQYLPFSPSHAQIYEEAITRRDEAPQLPTKALEYTQNVVALPETRLVVLTGDAGHGKTHLCRRLLEPFGLSANKAIEWMIAHKNGDEVALPGQTGRGLRIVKDLSDLLPDEGATVMSRALSPDAPKDQCLVVCANEGRLRDVIARSPDQLRAVKNGLDAGQQSGMTSVDPRVYVVNLNYQSVTNPRPCLFESLMRTWVCDDRKWKTCERCDARARCPISWNRECLAGNDDSDDVAAGRREGLRHVLQVAEESGQVITIRELLILSAFVVTGGLGCEEVEKRVRERRKADWQHAHVFHQVLFESRLEPAQRRCLPILGFFEKIDPGKRAIRRVDEPLATGLVSLESAFSPQAPPDDPVARTRKQLADDADRIGTVMRFLRRRDYFDLATDLATDGAVKALASRSERLGLRHYGDFEFLRSQTPATDTRRLVETRDRLLSGLHAVQGVHLQPGRIHFCLLDPAFARTEGTAAIVARELAASAVVVRSESGHWATMSNNVRPALPAAVNWLDRRIVVELCRGEPPLQLDLMQFEYVMRAADGLSCRNFFRAEIRRILARLAALADSSSEKEGVIKVVTGSVTRSVMIDQDFIRTSEG